MFVRMAFRDSATEEYRRAGTRLVVPVPLRARLETGGGAVAVSLLGAVAALRVARHGWLSARDVCRRCRGPLAHRVTEAQVPIEVVDANDGARVELSFVAAVNRCASCGALHLLDVEDAMELVLDYLSTCDFAATGALPNDRSEWLARRARVDRVR
jgi:hypothetical protein